MKLFKSGWSQAELLTSGRLVSDLDDAIFNKPAGVKYYGKKALELGASEAQVVEAIWLVRMFAGRPAMVNAAEALRDEA